MATRLTRARMREAVEHLAARDADLGAIHREHGLPPLWARPAGFATLVLIILEQQVSLASGGAAFRRLERVAGDMTPDRVLRMGAEQIRNAGITRQKTRYVTELAEAIAGARLSLRAVARMNDDDARETLMQIPGIGPWTANIYLLMALRRVDVWPVHDLALRKAFALLCRLDEPPSDEALAALAARWAPYRAVAARMLWHYYLTTLGRGSSPSG